ncbi:hypothetical protein [Aliarcobacter butzleri]|uniref:hypothetical protein n=1 Tax=Aliarcobacter butzleri TaxID=28197 RepID=UPI002B24F1D8|nr:hypothetical protein [Aliarcobacter butzleri]
MDISLLSNEAVLGYMVGGIYYDAVKSTTVSSFVAIKEKVKKYFSLDENEVSLIEKEVEKVDKNITFEEFRNYIIANEQISEILKNLQTREPQKTKEIIESFKNNKDTKFDLLFGDNYLIKNSFNENQNCEIKIG